jgi:Helix-turn-helix domain
MIYTIIFWYPYTDKLVNHLKIGGRMNWQLLARANTHPLRIAILEVLGMDGGRTLSPSELSYELRTPLSNVNYHVTELVKSELLKLTGERSVRGATEHFYRAENGSVSQNGRVSKA